MSQAMSHDGRKRISLYIIIVAMVIVLTSGLTVYISQRTNNAISGGLTQLTKRSSDKGQYKHFGIFAGYDVCKAAIISDASGKVISLESDDRTAHYQGYNDTNVITFSAEIKPDSIPFLSTQRSTYHASIKCATSAQDNKLVNLSWLTTDPYGVRNSSPE